MMIARSGLASSISLPNTRIAAMSASNCSGTSDGGLTNNCGACTVATAATIFPILCLLVPSAAHEPNRPTQASTGVLHPQLERVAGGHYSHSTPSSLSLALRPYISKPNSPERKLCRFFSSLATRAWLALATSAAFSRGTTTTPSISPTTTSPGWIAAPAHTTGIFTDPAVALTVPCALMALDHTGKSMAVSSLTSRTPASMINPRTPCATREVASKSPNMPSVESEPVVTTRTSPGWHTATAAWIMRLSPDWQSTVTAGPATLAVG